MQLSSARSTRWCLAAVAAAVSSSSSSSAAAAAAAGADAAAMAAAESCSLRTYSMRLMATLAWAIAEKSSGR